MARPTACTGSKPPTSKDVAALAGVSQTTVSFVINGKSTVAPATRKRVLDAMQALQYHPNASARILRTSRTHILALFVSMHATTDANETTPYIDAIAQAAAKHDYDVIINTDSHDTSDMQRLSARSLCDAFILMDITMDDARIPIATRLPQPTVLIGRPKDALDLDLVDLDARAAAISAVEELAATGHRHVAVVGESLTDADSSSDTNINENMAFIREFYAGISEACERTHLDYCVVPRMTSDWHGFVASADQLLTHADDRLGIIVRQPRVLQWVLWYLAQHNLTPGHDVSVIAHCSDDSAAAFPTPVSNVSTMPATIAATAASLALQRLANPLHGPQRKLVAPNGVTRRQTTAIWHK